MESIEKYCPECGAQYEYKKYDVKGHVKYILLPSCNCGEKKYIDFESRVKPRVSGRILPLNSLAPLYNGYDFSVVEKTSIAIECKKFADSFSASTQEGFAFIGNTGCGKSVLLACICKEIQKRGFSFLFIKLSALLDWFTAGLSFDTSYTTGMLLSALREPDFIVLDDFGRECISGRRQEFLFRIIEELSAYEKCVSITANPEMLKPLKARADYAAIFDRLAKLCPHTYFFKGESYRRYEKPCFIAVPYCKKE